MNKILLIEDNPIILQICQAMLLAIDELNCQVDTANNGELALSLIEENRYDLILTDIGLPDMKGYEIANHIRSHTNPDISKTPIIAVTGHSHPLDYYGGITELFLKPLTISIMKTFTKYLPHS
jgi:CheY-like chemotaxis protein